MEYRSGWTPKDRKTETEVERCYKKDTKEKQVKIEEAQDRRRWRLKTSPTQIGKRPNKKKVGRHENSL